MPWSKDNNGEDIYCPSSYSIEDLPTWNEVYNEYYLNNILYDIDPYWKFPRKKILTALICNQFNKMLFEDRDKYRNLYNEAIKLCKEFNKIKYNKDINIEHVSFMCDNPDEKDWSEAPMIEGCYIIYSVKPIENKNIFYTLFDKKCYDDTVNNDEHCTEDKDSTELGLVHVQNLYKDINMVLTGVYARDDEIDTPTFKLDEEYTKKLIDIMIQPIKEYFENGIGWKDQTSSTKHIGCITGFDPAI